MKTVLQQEIERQESLLKRCNPDGFSAVHIKGVIATLTGLLPASEKELKEAYGDGHYNGMSISHPLSNVKDVSANDWFRNEFGEG